LAFELADIFNVETFEIQHHWSHAVSLMLDADITEPLIVLTLDGAGYGPDGTIWGSEILYSYFDRYKHLGSTELLPLIGGDMAVHHPRRLVFGIYEKLGLNSDDLNYFAPHEAEVYRNILKTSPQTSSFGRVLDSISCYLGIATERTYDGEPAMKLERYLAMGKKEYEFETEISMYDDKPNIVRTMPLFKQLFELVGDKNPFDLTDAKKANLSYSFVNEFIRNLVKISLDGTKLMDVKYFGISGGVTYNLPIVDMIQEEVKSAKEAGDVEKGLKFLTHSRLPNGDGGISAGQNAIAGHMLASKE
jgi:hydrogenase maturation protein HypF